jgi:hypothetical protein
VQVQGQADGGCQGLRVCQEMFHRCLRAPYGRPRAPRSSSQARQARVGAAGADDLDGGLGVLRYLGQAVELPAHHLRTTSGSYQCRRVAWTSMSAHSWNQ